MENKYANKKIENGGVKSPPLISNNMSLIEEFGEYEKANQRQHETGPVFNENLP